MNSTIEVLAFGQLTDILGKNGVIIDDVRDVAELKSRLQQQFPALGNSRFKVAVNTQLIKDNASLHPGDVVALLPPFSGG